MAGSRYDPQASRPSRSGEDPLTLRPLGVLDVLDEVFAVYRRGFRTFVAITALVQVPYAIVALPIYAASAQIGRRLERSGDMAAAVEALGGPLAGFGGGLIVATVVGTILQLAATCYATSGIYLGEAPTIGGAYRLALGQFWPLFRLGLLLGATFLGLFALALAPIVMPALLCLSMPAVFALMGYLGVLWSLAVPAQVLEPGSGPRAGLGRSAALVRGAWWRTFGTLALLTILIMVLQLIASGLVEAIIAGVQAVVAAGEERPDWIATLGGLLQSLTAVLYGPLAYIGVTLIYYDRRIRVEGFDLAVLARALAHEPPGAPAS